MRLKKRFLNILFWSVISAAFIGPGTITTAAKSGADLGYELLWALLFSTIACFILQEATSRLPVISGKNLGQAISGQFSGSRFRVPVLILVLGAIVLGAAAYETGNLVGAAAGIKLLIDIPSYLSVTIIVIAAAVILSIPSLKIISTILGFLVVTMGFGFLATAILIHPSYTDVLKGILIPRFPTGVQSWILVIGLIGTTIVPYNLFLGSSISDKGQSVKEMRTGLAIAIFLGGIFSMAVMVTGSSVAGEFSFEALAIALQEKIGTMGRYLLGAGLFAAGFTSAVTAPLAAALTLKSLFGNKRPEKWRTNSLNFRSGWIVILFCGFIFGILNVKPIPAIILAQALNGFILPFISIFLFLVINNYGASKKRSVRLLSNSVMIVVIFITLILGLMSAEKVFHGIFFREGTPGQYLPYLIVLISFILSAWIWTFANKNNK